MKASYITPNILLQELHTTIICGSGDSLLPELDLSTDHHSSPKDAR